MQVGCVQDLGHFPGIDLVSLFIILNGPCAVLCRQEGLFGSAGFVGHRVDDTRKDDAVAVVVHQVVLGNNGADIQGGSVQNILGVGVLVRHTHRLITHHKVGRTVHGGRRR